MTAEDEDFLALLAFELDDLLVRIRATNDAGGVSPGAVCSSVRVSERMTLSITVLRREISHSTGPWMLATSADLDSLD